MFDDPKPQRREYKVNTAVMLVEEHAHLNAQLQEALEGWDKTPKPPQRAGTRKAAYPPEVLELTDQVEALEKRMEGSWVTFVLEQRPRKEWRTFQAAHPAEAKLPSDQVFSVNMEALIEEFLPLCIVEPQLADGEWERAINGGIWDGDLERMAALVAGFYMRTFDNVPKSRLVLAVRATYDGQPEQLATSEPPSDASTGGSPKSATTTTPQTGS